MKYLLDTHIWLERLLNAELHAVQLVSFDKDFDRTKHGRLTPEAILRQFMTTKVD